MSRRYGGIHFVDGDLRSRAMGRSCGAQAFDAARAYWEGRSPAVAAARPPGRQGGVGPEPNVATAVGPFLPAASKAATLTVP